MHSGGASAQPLIELNRAEFFFMGLAQLALLLRKYYVYLNFKIIIDLSFVSRNISNRGSNIHFSIIIDSQLRNQ